MRNKEIYFLLSLALSVKIGIGDSRSVALLDETRAMIYLMRYGYAAPNSWSSSLVTEAQYREYIRDTVMDFQAFAGIEQTGAVDSHTMEMMEMPRCGVKDTVGQGAQLRRRKRFVLQGSIWKKKRLTWSISRYPSRQTMRREEIVDTAARAFQLWAQASGLEFINAGDNSVSVDIEIRFESYEHGDGEPLDGPGGTLAHAFFPLFGGDVHLDDSEVWTINTARGTNMLQTLTHEIGHSLGLSHSDQRNSLMAPFYRGYEPNLSLKEDDILAIQSLYGPYIPKSTPSPMERVLCSEDISIDAIFRTSDNMTYVFKGDQYWRLTSEAIAPGYPQQVTSGWGGRLPANIDAALTWEKKGITYIFKGDKYWKYRNMDPLKGYPKFISSGFPGIPDDIDSAFVWSGNDKIYFTKGSKYWKFDPVRVPHVNKRQYPKPISKWGLPGDIDGAFQWNNRRTYFFKSGQYWRFDDRTVRVAKAVPEYPRDTGEWWFGCKI